MAAVSYTIPRIVELTTLIAKDCKQTERPSRLILFFRSNENYFDWIFFIRTVFGGSTTDCFIVDALESKRYITCALSHMDIQQLALQLMNVTRTWNARSNSRRRPKRQASKSADKTCSHNDHSMNTLPTGANNREHHIIKESQHDTGWERLYMIVRARTSIGI